jgi:hypothetical protein
MREYQLLLLGFALCFAFPLHMFSQSDNNPILLKNKHAIYSGNSEIDSPEIIKQAHQNIFINIKGKPFQKAVLSYINEKRQEIAPHFPNRNFEKDIIKGIQNWQKKYNTEYDNYLAFLYNLNILIRNEGSNYQKYANEINVHTGKYSQQNCNSSLDAVYFGDFCADITVQAKASGQNPGILTCNIQASICTPGVAGPFNFNPSTPNTDFAQGCLNQEQGQNSYGLCC